MICSGQGKRKTLRIGSLWDIGFCDGPRVEMLHEFDCGVPTSQVESGAQKCRPSRCLCVIIGISDTYGLYRARRQTPCCRHPGSYFILIKLPNLQIRRYFATNSFDRPCALEPMIRRNLSWKSRRRARQWANKNYHLAVT